MNLNNNNHPFDNFLRGKGIYAVEAGEDATKIAIGTTTTTTTNAISTSNNNNSNQHGDDEDFYGLLLPYDVICGKCRTAFNHVGNRRFRVTIGLNMQRYMDAPTRQDKSQVIKSVVETFRKESGARFYKKGTNNNTLVELDDKYVRQKVGHALRDMAVQKRFESLASSSSSISIILSPSPGPNNNNNNNNTATSPKRRSSFCAAPQIRRRRSSMCSVKSQSSTKSAPEPIRTTSYVLYTPTPTNTNTNTNNISNQGNDEDFWADDLSVTDEGISVSKTDILFPDMIVSVTPDTPAKSCKGNHEFKTLTEELDSIQSLLNLSSDDIEQQAFEEEEGHDHDQDHEGLNLTLSY